MVFGVLGLLLLSPLPIFSAANHQVRPFMREVLNAQSSFEASEIASAVVGDVVRFVDPLYAAMVAAAHLYLDCYWVGSLDFNFLGNQGVFHSTHKKLNFLQRGQQQQRYLNSSSASCDPLVTTTWSRWDLKPETRSEPKHGGTQTEPFGAAWNRRPKRSVDRLFSGRQENPVRLLIAVGCVKPNGSSFDQ